MDQATIIITGASRGIGAAAARSAAAMGANVVLAARSMEPLEALARELETADHHAIAVQADVSRPEDCQKLIWEAVGRFGRIDGLVNNAGVVEPMAPIANADPQSWMQNWMINLLAPVLLTRLALPALRERGGRVINVSSGAAINIIGGWGAYSSAKAALNHLTQVLAAEEPAITALSVRPGIVDTEMQVVIRTTGAGRMSETHYQRLSGMHEQGNLLPPSLPGHALAVLALHAPHAWSGDVIQWDDAKVQALVDQHPAASPAQ